MDEWFMCHRPRFPIFPAALLSKTGINRGETDVSGEHSFGSGDAHGGSAASLDYQGARKLDVKYTSMLALSTASIAFGTVHWITEYCCQCLYHLQNAGPPGTRIYSRALDDMQLDMMIETVVIVLCSL